MFEARGLHEWGQPLGPVKVDALTTFPAFDAFDTNAGIVIAEGIVIAPNSTRYFHAMLRGPHLAITSWNRWDGAAIAKSFAPKVRDVEVHTVAELEAAIQEAIAQPHPTMYLWIAEDLEHEIRKRLATFGAVGTGQKPRRR